MVGYLLIGRKGTWNNWVRLLGYLLIGRKGAWNNWEGVVEKEKEEQ